MKDYNVTLRVRNNYLLETMRSNGYFTAADLSRDSGVSQQSIGKMLNFKLTPYGKSRKHLSESVSRLCDFFGCAPDALFPAEHMCVGLEKNVAEIAMSAEEVSTIMSPEDALLADETSTTLQKMLSRLSPKYRQVLVCRFGLEGEPKSVAEIAEELGVSKARVAQMVATGLSGLRRSARYHRLSGLTVDEFTEEMYGPPVTSTKAPEPDYGVWAPEPKPEGCPKTIELPMP